MGREIHYTIESPRPFTAVEMKNAERVVNAANKLFHNYSGTDFVNLSYDDAFKDGEQFFHWGSGAGSTKPHGEENALFLFACLVALSHALPSAAIAIHDEGSFGVMPTIKRHTVLQAGWVRYRRPDGTLSDRVHASCAIVAGHPIEAINAGLPTGVKKFPVSPVRTLLRQNDVRELVPRIVAAIKGIASA